MRATRVLAVTGLLVALVGVGCGGDDQGTQGTTTGAAAATSVPATTTTAAPTTAAATTAPSTLSTTARSTSTTSAASGGACSRSAFEQGLPYPGLSVDEWIVRFRCSGDWATVLVQPPTDAPSFVLVLRRTPTAWVFDRDCHNDVVGVANCLADLDSAVVDELALVGEAYWRDDLDPGAWPAECATPARHLGDTGVCVAKLQTMLDRVAGADLAVDGRFGAATHQHVIEFQATHGLAVDGYAGQTTWAALMDDLGRL